MRNKDGGAPLHHLAQVVENFFFGVGINAGQRVVQNENPWVTHNGSGNRGSLLLAAGKGDTALSDHGFIFFDKTLDIRGNACRLSRRAHLIVSGVGYTKSDVVAHAGAEYKRPLPHKAPAAPQRSQGIFVHRPAITQTRTRTRSMPAPPSTPLRLA